MVEFIKASVALLREPYRRPPGLPDRLLTNGLPHTASLELGSSGRPLDDGDSELVYFYPLRAETKR
jgi:hypothetical protein